MNLEDLGLQIDQKDIHHLSISDPMTKAVWNFEYVPEHKLVIYIAKGYFSTENIQNIYLYLAQYTYHHQLSVLCSITDSSELEGSFHQMNDWFANEFLPKVIANGFRANANIVSKDFYVQLAQEDLDEMIQGLFVQKHFEDFQEGYDWITNQDWDSA